MPESDFDKLLLEAVDEGLSLLGQSVKQSIYFHLEKSFSIRREEIPCRIAAFVQAIENIFGVGAKFLEKLIAERLYVKVGAAVEPNGSKNFGFAEHITVAKKSFHESSRIRTPQELIECGETEE